MDTVTLKLERRHVQKLKEQAEATGRSQAAVVRELIDRHLGAKRSLSLHDRARDLCGSITAGSDLSTRRLDGYGRD
jgi:predicted DNA-binding protein